jgi:hypothetical protein
LAIGYLPPCRSVCPCKPTAACVPLSHRPTPHKPRGWSTWLVQSLACPVSGLSSLWRRLINKQTKPRPGQDRATTNPCMCAQPDLAGFARLL